MESECCASSICSAAAAFHYTRARTQTPSRSAERSRLAQYARSTNLRAENRSRADAAPFPTFDSLLPTLFSISFGNCFVNQLFNGSYIIYGLSARPNSLAWEPAALFAASRRYRASRDRTFCLLVTPHCSANGKSDEKRLFRRRMTAAGCTEHSLERTRRSSIQRSRQDEILRLESSATRAEDDELQLV